MPLENAHNRNKPCDKTYSQNFAKMEKWSLHLLVLSILVVAIYGQNLAAYVSIDCGNTKNYTDQTTGLVFAPDDQYIDTGINYNISSDFTSQINQTTTVRSFPTGNRNCYTLKPAIKNSKYLIRAIFFYGNYDGKYQTNTAFLFDLHIGVNFWRTVNITNAGVSYEYEAITIALADFISVCLVNNGSGTPFISSLEMRPFKSILYPAVNVSNFFDLIVRRDLGGSKTTRYPDDPYDRIWYPALNKWTPINTKSNVQTFSEDVFQVPNVVMQTAILPINTTNSTVLSADQTTSGIAFHWPIDPLLKNPMYFVNFHFADVQLLPSDGIREFNIFYDEKPEPLCSQFRPTYLLYSSIYSTSQLNSPSNSNGYYEFSLNATTNATVPPLINALEIFNLLPVKTAMTNLSDVDAIMTIKTEYQVKKNWTGDPCAPIEYAWAGVACSYIQNSSRILTLNLSDSGLSGPISRSFLFLEALEKLDLSNNILNGSIPEFLTNMHSLQFLDLSYNNFSGPIPDALLARANSGQLILRTNGSVDHTAAHSGKKVNLVIVFSVIAVVLVFLLISLIAWKFLCQSSAKGPKLHPLPAGEPIVRLKTKRYTKKDLENITNSFTQKIGQGGFGAVFAGTLSDEKGTKVAVKKLSESSDQGFKEFLAEAENLAMLHHRNLVCLVGYCEEDDCLALVYEYMSQGSLEDHLQGRSHGKNLSWRERLRVAFEAAEGLNYLHQGCLVRFIHRDVKSSNILLTEELKAKVSDLGTVRALSNQKSETLATRVCGTMGYLDPQYGVTGLLTQKSDVYSFGAILFEIMTGQRPGPGGPEGVILIERVRQQMAEQNSELESIIDVRLQGDYGLDSVWSVFELARGCTQDEPEQRPTMEFVVTELKNALTMEDDRLKNGQNNRSRNNQGANRISNPVEFANQNLRSVSDIFGHGPDLR